MLESCPIHKWVKPHELSPFTRKAALDLVHSWMRCVASMNETCCIHVPHMLHTYIIHVPYIHDPYIHESCLTNSLHLTERHHWTQCIIYYPPNRFICGSYIYTYKGVYVYEYIHTCKHTYTMDHILSPEKVHMWVVYIYRYICIYVLTVSYVVRIYMFICI